MTKFKHPVSKSILEEPHHIGSRSLEVREYLSEEEAFVKLCEEKNRKIFVGGLPVNIDSEFLKSYFQ